jgi:hypothetical protein
LRGYRNSSLLEGHAKGWKEAAMPLEKSDGPLRGETAERIWKGIYAGE